MITLTFKYKSTIYILTSGISNSTIYLVRIETGKGTASLKKKIAGKYLQDIITRIPTTYCKVIRAEDYINHYPKPEALQYKIKTTYGAICALISTCEKFNICCIERMDKRV